MSSAHPVPGTCREAALLSTQMVCHQHDSFPSPTGVTSQSTRLITIRAVFPCRILQQRQAELHEMGVPGSPQQCPVSKAHRARDTFPPFYFSEASARADTPLPPRCRGPLPIQPRPVFRFQPPSLRLSPPLLASVYSLPFQPLRELPRRCLATPTLPRALSSLRVAQPATHAVPGRRLQSPSRWPLPPSPPLRVMSGT